MLLLLATAHAAEPDLAGVQLALGAGLEAGFGPTGIVAAPIEGALRLHVGPRWIIELGVAGGVTSHEWIATRETLDDGVATEADHDETVENGWNAGGGLRTRFRVNAAGPVGFYAGLGVAYEHSEATAPTYANVEDPDTGEATLQEVGRIESEREEIALDASLAAVHWVSDRVAVSGTFTVPFASWDTRSESEIDTTGAVEVVDDRDVFHDTGFGFWPTVGVSVHLRL